ncbi:uncharacterized protein (DUF2336 family) [Peteryoungia aggregata LMG 23059]|uniref:Uncharacterized protein (DUF2336 family) n=1 Tax=Peteryoungia aggregata LMG 23059 TaxID=1368425 RepID=A0ABU0G773_9HYPH|nr:DUF2336 domain-containing protein [Peteryoungia aggregata]MDQ0421190.1 uncharacterized protein (DUF2336 family) [Peteryoungia aggregata LMG 23059]
MIVTAFLKWVETAKTQERARAANALARAYLKSEMTPEERQAAQMAMTYLLDDPSPQVRLALAEVLAGEARAPRALMVSLAEDQPEIASAVILHCPVLTDADLVDIAGRGTMESRALIAARSEVSVAVAAALAEIGDAAELEVLLENPGARFATFTLRRIAERHGHCERIRARLLDRNDLAIGVRQLLVQFVADALAGSDLVIGAIGSRRIERIAREAGDSATIALLADVHGEELYRLTDQLRAAGRLTPAFLMHALCAGRTDFFSSAMVAISGLEERRVRSILATGRFHALRALLESAGISREISPIFVDAVMLWRTLIQSAEGFELDHIAHRLVSRYRGTPHLSDAARALTDMIERLAIAEERRLARDYASGVALAAA